MREPYYPDLLPHKRPLWREFAALPTDDVKAFVAFVQKYGPLRNPEILEGPDGSAFELRDSPTRTVYAERVWHWEKHVQVLRTVRVLFDAVRLGKHDYLEHNVRLSEKLGLWEYTTPEYPPFTPGHHIHRVTQHDITPTTPEEAARAVIQHLVNEGLQENAAPRLLFGGARPEGEYGPLPRDLGLYLVPSTLLGYLYLTCAEEVSGKTAPRHCDGCKKLFIATDSRDMYCSRECGQTFRRAKKNPTGRGRGRPRKADRIPICIPEPKDPQESQEG